MAGAFLYRNLIRRGVGLAADGAVTGSDGAALFDPQPRFRARWAGTAAAILVDFGGTRAIDCVALVSTTLGAFGALGVVRARLSTVDSTGAAGDAWDTGSIAAATDATAAGNIVLVRGAGTASGRYLLVEVVDGTAPYVEIGLAIAGEMWRLTRAQSYGFVDGRLILDTRDRNPMTAAEFPVPALVNPRFTAFQVAVMGNAETIGAQRTMLASLGGVGDALWIPDTALPQAEINARSIWGAAAKPGEEAGATRAVFPGWNRAWRLIERV
jgi:hypothetical protein